MEKKVFQTHFSLTTIQTLICGTHTFLLMQTNTTTNQTSRPTIYKEPQPNQESKPETDTIQFDNEQIKTDSKTKKVKNDQVLDGFLQFYSNQKNCKNATTN